GTTLNFGLLTHAALMEWQEAVGIAFPTGNFGPATRAYISTHYLVTPGLPNTGDPSLPGFTSLTALGLKDGDTISAIGSSDPDIYIANAWGYKRLFLNPVIFSFYNHLGGFAKVRTVSSSTRDMLVASGIFRNCEANDPEVYGLEVTGEDTGTLHWINTTGEQAIADDPDFFKKVFCINNSEFNWYQKGSDYTTVTEIPIYSRMH
ncbi:MAG: hypothetical protein Q8Q06_00055, partial [bacterium]|nr:hypothetical protein [bacterium]